MIEEKTVFVFDICSSTVMMEDAQVTSSLDSYAKMIEDISAFLKNVQSEYNFAIYKFLGDGFILLFEESSTVENIYEFSEELVDVAGKIILIYIENHLQNRDLPRVGITIGVDSGVLVRSGNEYMGRAINMACRLQGKLDLTDSVNRIIVSQKVYGKIMDPVLKKKFQNKPKILKNVNRGKEIPCYESSPIVLANINEKSSIALKANETGLYTQSAGTVISTILKAKGRYTLSIKRADGRVIFESEETNDTNSITKLINVINSNNIRKK